MAIRRGNVTYDDMEYQQGPRAEALVSTLETLISSPRKQIEKYMKLRSKRSVDKLTDILQEYKSVKPGDDRAAGPEPKKSGGEGASTSGSDAAAKLASIHKLKGLAWKSTYQSFHSDAINESQSARTRRKAVGSGAFDKVWRNGEKPQLDLWKESTTDDNIRQLADTCRGIYSLEEQEDGPRSEYRKRFGRSSHSFTPRIVRDRNRSEVPIGSIYSTDPWELEASAVREKEAKDALLGAAKTQDMMMKYKLYPKKSMALTWIDRSKMGKYREGSEVNGCLQIQSRAQMGVIRSEYRARYIAHA